MNRRFSAFLTLIFSCVMVAGASAQVAIPYRLPDSAPDDKSSSVPAKAVHIQLSPENASTTNTFVRVYTIHSPTEFTAGNLADAFLGDFVLENEQFRAVVAKPGKTEMGVVRGGTLQDVTRSEAPVDYISGLNTTVSPTTTGSIVLYDSAQIGAVINETTGSLTLSGYVGDPGSPIPPRNKRVSVRTRYTIAKGSPVLRLDTDFINLTTHTAWLQPADMIDWGEMGVFSAGGGFGATTSPVVFVVGAADDFSLGYYTSGTKPMGGFHHARESVVLASGSLQDLEAHIQAVKHINDQGANVPAEFRGTGASTVQGPGMVMFPGTETRYTMGVSGMPVPTPVYVPKVNLKYVDGKATVTQTAEVEQALFMKPSDESQSASVRLDPGKTYTFTRYLVVSDSNWDPISRHAFKEKGMELGELGGAVVEASSGDRIADATVRISGGPDWDGTGKPPALVQVTTDSNGTFRAHLPEGKYRLDAVATGRRGIGSVQSIDVKTDGKLHAAVLKMTDESLLRMAISEAETATSSPLPVKVTIISKPPFPVQNYGFTPDVSKGVRNTYYLPQGAAVFPINPGRYRLVISRGIEYDILEKDIAIAPGQELTVTGSLPHVMKGLLPGMVSMDAGIATNASAVGFATAESRVIQAACEGVSIIVSGDYGKATNFQTAIRNQGLEKWVKSFVGRRELLHKNGMTVDLFVYPLDAETSASFDKAIEAVEGLPPDIALADLKKQFPKLIFEISRPMHPEFGYLESFKFDEQKEEFVGDNMPPPDFDAIQVMEGKKLGLEKVVYPRYMALQLARLGSKDLYEAAPLSPFGSSFSRLPYGEEVGYPRAYLYLNQPKSMAEVTADDIISAVRGQKYLVTNGPILLFDALDYESLRFNVTPGEIVDLSTTEVVRIRARVLAAPWVHLQGLSTRENGVRGISVLNTQPSNAVLRYPANPTTGSNVYTRYLDADAVLDAFCYSTVRSLAPVVPDALDDFGGEYYPYCMTGPIFVDRNGDGKIVIKEKKEE